MVILRYEDDCIEPTAKVKVEYKGPNPFEAYKKVLELLKVKLNISDDEIFERDFRWDSTSDEKSGFFIRIYIMKNLDTHTHTFIEIIFNGDQPRDIKKPGSLTISVITKLVTQYALDTPLERTVFFKNLLNFYYNNFYKKIRENYFKDCRELSDKIIKEIKDSLNIKE